MISPSPWRCDVCQRRKLRDDNGWWLAFRIEAATAPIFTLEPWDDDNPGLQVLTHLCSNGCATILQQRFMADVKAHVQKTEALFKAGLSAYFETPDSPLQEDSGSPGTGRLSDHCADAESMGEMPTGVLPKTFISLRRVQEVHAFTRNRCRRLRDSAGPCPPLDQAKDSQR